MADTEAGRNISYDDAVVNNKRKIVAVGLGVAISFGLICLFAVLGLSMIMKDSNNVQQQQEATIHQQSSENLKIEDLSQYIRPQLDLAPSSYEEKQKQEQNSRTTINQFGSFSHLLSERSSCNINGFSGTCQDSSRVSCSGGTYVSGHCPGASNIRCCTRSGQHACSDGSRQGLCINTNTQSSQCRGTIVSGRCPGASNIRCCTRGGSSSSSSSSSTSGGSGALSKCEVVSAFRSAGFNNAEVARLTCIAYYESRWNPSAMNTRNGNGSWDWGILQINDRWWCRSSNGAGTGCNTGCNNLIGRAGVIASARCARTIIREQGWTAWVAYTSNRRTCDNYNIAGC